MNPEEILKNATINILPEARKKRERALYFDRLREMTFCEWKLREQSTIYGFLWTLLNPLLTFAVLYVVFTKWMGAKVGDYAAFIFLLLVAMILSLSLFLSILDARYQDFERIWGIVVSVGFFLTPIFYTMDIITPARRRFLWLNPMTSIIDMTRQAALQGHFPNPKEFFGILIFTILLAVLGGVFFKKQENKIADYVTV